MAQNKKAPAPTRGGLFKKIFLALLGLGLAGFLAGLLALAVIFPKLPSLETLTDYRPKIPLRVYTADGVLIGEFGEERRTPVSISQIPLVMQHAVLAAEDDGFYDHFGIDIKGVIRAVLGNVTAGRLNQGASTITMQVARNFFLTRDRTFTRKVYEALLALKIEAHLSKPQILELYMNQIYLGERAYGFATASNTYFGKPIQEINAAEAAMLAGLPKAPSAFNPIVNPSRAKIRQEYVLGRMLKLGHLTQEQYDQAKQVQLSYVGRKKAFVYEVDADYAAEMARRAAIELYGKEAYDAGLKITTTLVAKEQQAAYKALRDGVMNYEKRQFYRGPEGYIELPANPVEAEAEIANQISDYPDYSELVSAVVLKVSPKEVVVSRGNGEPLVLKGKQIEPVASWLNPGAPSNKRLKRGAVVRVLVSEGEDPILTQMPEVEAALVALDTQSGSIRALVGGFEFRRNKFNHVTQSIRQPGSSFKPFIYSASLEKGVTPTTLVADEPIFVPAQPGGKDWTPKNYDGKYDGPLLLKEGLAKSKNMVSIRVLQEISPDFAQQWAMRFGFAQSDVPAYLTMALGAVTTNPLQVASAYSVFANGGYRVSPYLIEKITDASGRVIAQARPVVAGLEANRVIDGRNAFLTTRLLREVVDRGTAVRAKSLGRSDIVGKTGTTNDSHDAWFAGYNPDIAAVAWVGYDQPRNLGARETGGGLALPMWIDYMKVALASSPEKPQRVPPGIDFVDGNYYYSEYTPGFGIAKIDVEDALPKGEIPSLFDFLRGLGVTDDNGNSVESGSGDGTAVQPPVRRGPPGRANTQGNAQQSEREFSRDEIETLFGN